jgi:5'-nucleotidase (lipoprotein e(P4) family)
MTTQIIEKMFMRKAYTIAIAASLLVACNTPQKEAPSQNNQEHPNYLHGVKATTYFKTAIENHWVFEQLYDVAEIKLRNNLQKAPKGMPVAVILDLDETVLDNSQYELENIGAQRTYTLDTWKAWTARGIAPAMPGALRFCNAANDLGVQIFYVSNREVDELEGTLKNLQQLGFPQAEAAHVLLKDGESDKTIRRDMVIQKHYVALLCGDNFRDFMETFAERHDRFGAQLLADYADTLRSHFVLFPNPMYGEWEKPIQSFLKNPINPDELLAQ